MKKQLYLSLISIMYMIIMVIIIVVNSQALPSITIKKGHGNFEDYNYKTTYTLSGEWEIYYNEFIATDNIDITNLQKEYITIPTKNKDLNYGYGYASYRIVLENVKSDEEIMLTLNSITGGYAVYLNRNLLITNDKLYRGNEKINFPNRFNNYITDNSNSLEIIIEVSNYQLGYTGLRYPIEISSFYTFRREFISYMVFWIAVISSLAFASIYHFFVNGVRSIDTNAIFYALFGICGVVSFIFYRASHAFIIENIFDIDEKLIYYLHYTSLYLATLFLFLSIRSLFKKSKLNHLELCFLIIIIFYTLLPYAISIKAFSAAILFFNVLNLISLLIIFIWTVMYAKPHSMYFPILIITLTIVLSYTYDTLIEENIIIGQKTTTIVMLFTTLLFGAISSFKREVELSNVQEVIDLNKKIRDTEFTFLNSQIQSHFIYNTLNAIQSLCYTNPNRAAELIDDFSMYLRTRLEFNKMPKLIDIEDELENIRTYTNIEQERFGKRIKIEYDLKVGDFKIPPLTVQPLVENAIKHGISKKKQGGTVKIQTKMDHSNILIIISDDGVGFDPESLPEKQRVGTENIRHRLNLNLGASLKIESQLGVGTTSTITIPMNYRKEKV